MYAFVEFEEKYDWNIFFKDFRSFLKEISRELIYNGPFPRFHPQLSSLIDDQNKCIVEINDIPTDIHNEKSNIYQINQEVMKKLFNSLIVKQDEVKPPNPKIKKVNQLASPTKLSNNEVIDFNMLPILEPDNIVLSKNSVQKVPKNYLTTTCQQSRKQWTDDDVNELARLLAIHHNSSHRWKTILDTGQRNNFFIGRTNINLKDKARQMKELHIKQNKDVGVWMHAVNR